jgi:hypothetical protein
MPSRRVVAKAVVLNLADRLERWPIAIPVGDLVAAGDYRGADNGAVWDPAVPADPEHFANNATQGVQLSGSWPTSCSVDGNGLTDQAPRWPPATCLEALDFGGYERGVWLPEGDCLHGSGGYTGPTRGFIYASGHPR